MEQKNHICASICDQLPTLSAYHPWLVDGEHDHILYTVHDPLRPLTQHRYQIPSSLGRRIRGCFYGWVVLSNNDMWSLWNPVTVNIIRLPRLQDPDLVQQCCLSSPPDVIGSVLMLTLRIPGKYAIVFCRLGSKRRGRRLRWVKMAYAKQMRSLTRGYDGFLYSLTCCNGKVYALSTANDRVVIRIDLVSKGRANVLRLFPYLKTPVRFVTHGCSTFTPFLAGCCSELFYISLGFAEEAKETLCGVYACKVDMTDVMLEYTNDLILKDSTFFLDLAHDCAPFYSHSDQFGGYVHILGKSGKVIQSYDVKNKTVALSSMPTALLESSRVQGDDGESKCGAEEEVYKEENEMMVWDDDNMGSRDLPFITFDVLKMIMKFCVGVEYLHFRASCKQCLLELPMIRWSSKEGRLRTYSLHSPWLVVLDKDRDVITFINPRCGDKYFITKPRLFTSDMKIHCSKYGWMLISGYLDGPLVFYNAFTSDIRMLSKVPGFHSYCFSAPPTSSDCVVAGFETRDKWRVCILHLVAATTTAAGPAPWRTIHIPHLHPDALTSFCFATSYGRHNLYALRHRNTSGQLAFMDIDKEEDDYTLRQCLTHVPRSRPTQDKYLMKCDEELLLVIVGEWGESVEVFKLKSDDEWERIESLGRRMIYICDATCLCIEAKTREMENKIYFPRLHPDSNSTGKIVFYSLETKRYHTFLNGNKSFGDFIGTVHHLCPHAWIEPSWS